MELFDKKRERSSKEKLAEAKRTIPESESESNESSKMGVYVFGMVLFIIGALAVLAIWAIVAPLGVVSCIVAAAFGALLTASVRIIPEWERSVVLRFGKFNRVVGPGICVIIPFVEYSAIHVDQRTITTAFSAEATLTADLVPVDVDAILFWMVWDARKACLEVDNYPKAVLRSAQTALRDAIGQMSLGDISMRRKQIDRELEEMLSSKCEEWGITVLSVEIRDITIPQELQDSLSREAQAERERNARVVLAEVEKDISEMYVEAADVYSQSPDAMKLRAMNLAYEGVRNSGGLVLAPSDLASAFDLNKITRE